MAKEGRMQWLNADAEEMRGGAILPSQIPADKILATVQAEPRDADVYFARRGPFIKIGCTRNLARRLAALASYRDPAGQVGPMRLLVTLPGGRATEGYFHSRFGESSVDGHGEWFHADQDVLSFVLRCLRIEAQAQTREGRDELSRELRDLLHGERDGVHV